MTFIDSRHPVLQAVDRLSAAFGARDVAATLDCFVADDDIFYEGSEGGERATGRGPVARLLGGIFSRPEAYTWEIADANVFLNRDVAYLSCEATGCARTDTGAATPFSYRLSGMLERTNSGWRWRACHGCEPALPATPPTAAESATPTLPATPPTAAEPANLATPLVNE
jgi:ketosteroid isomerase-like protein